MYLQHPLYPAVMPRCLCVSELWGVKNQHEGQGLMVCQGTKQEFNNKLHRQWPFISTFRSGGGSTSMLAPVCHCRVPPSVFPMGKPLLLTPPINMEGGYTFIEGSNGRLRDSYPEARAERQPITSCNGSPCVTDLTYISPLSFSQQPVTV